MNVRSPYLHGTNLLLLVATAAITLVSGVVALGPAAQRQAALRQIQSATRDELDRWERDFRSYRPITAAERERWEQMFASARQWIPAADTEPQIMAAVARFFEGGSVRGLDLQRGNPIASDAEDASAAEGLALLAVDGDQRMALRRIPLRVHLQASYADLARILHKLQTETAPIQVESLQIERGSGQDLILEAELVIVVRSARDAG
jgi:hypothetical protein